VNTLILNRETFELPADGWYQIAPIGEFPHAGAGVIQMVDAAACEAMANAFRAESTAPNFAGLLIDFDHFSLDGKQKSEAAGWITALEARVGKTADGRPQTADLGETYNDADGVEPVPPGDTDRVEPVPPVGGNLGNGGLWGKIRWSDAGEACVRGGRYRFLSPVWAKADCEDLGGGRLRPVRLMNAAVTNDPNIKGMVPLSNRAEGGKLKPDIGTYNAADGVEPVPPGAGEKVANGSPAPRFKWVLGVHDRHCPSCAGLAGQVHSMADWDAAGLRPGSAGLFCQGHCHCELVETDEPESGDLAAVAVRAEVENRRRRGEGGNLKAEMGAYNDAKILTAEIAKNTKEKDLVDFLAIAKAARRVSLGRAANRKTEGVMADEVKVVTEGKSVEELANALRFEQEKNAVLLDQVVVLEDELVNRSMSEFENVVSEGTREFWKQQLLSNREGALVALGELKAAKLALGARETVPTDGGGRQPLHNRGGKIRQGSPTGGETGRASVVDGVAARIRNRAHELCKSEGVPFSVAFRRAEREAGTEKG